LTDRGRALTQAGRTRFLSALVREFLTATELLERRARGDWGPDQHLDQLAPSPNLSPALAASSSSNGQRRAQPHSDATAVALFEAYIRDTQRKPRTVERWRCVFTALDQENWRAPGWDAQQWLDGLVGTGTPPRKPITVRDTWLSAARAVFNWAIRKRLRDAKGRRLVETNPFDGCSVTVPKRPVTRKKVFTHDEMQVILSAALTIEVPALRRKGWQWCSATICVRLLTTSDAKVRPVANHHCV
jgi:hypothetical protein